MPDISPDEPGMAWIEELTDEQCAEVFWLYVEPPEPFLGRYPPRLLGQALRHALRSIAREPGTGVAGHLAS
jgi:hypothetical protein